MLDYLLLPESENISTKYDKGIAYVYLLYLQSQEYYLDLVVLTVEYSFSVLSLHTLIATLEEKHKHTKHNFHVSGQIELSVVTSASNEGYPKVRNHGEGPS